MKKNKTKKSQKKFFKISWMLKKMKARYLTLNSRQSRTSLRTPRDLTRSGCSLCPKEEYLFSPSCSRTYYLCSDTREKKSTRKIHIYLIGEKSRIHILIFRCLKNSSISKREDPEILIHLRSIKNSIWWKTFSPKTLSKSNRFLSII